MECCEFLISDESSVQYQSKHTGQTLIEIDCVCCVTRQWHVDGAFYGKNPPAVTALQCAEAPTSVPKAHSFDDARPLQYRAGSTAYVSAVTAYDLCTPDEQEWALGVKVHYLQHPFKATAGLPMTGNGLRVVDDGRDYGPNESTDSAVQVLPLVWSHHTTGRRAIMVRAIIH